MKRTRQIGWRKILSAYDFEICFFLVPKKKSEEIFFELSVFSF